MDYCSVSCDLNVLIIEKPKFDLSTDFKEVVFGNLDWLKISCRLF